MAVDLTLAKQHLRVDHDDENSLITAYLNAAIDWVEGQTGKLLTRREVTQTEPGFLSYFRLHYGPAPATVSVEYTNSDNLAATVDDAMLSDGRLYPPFGEAWPAAARNTEVVLTYTAGYETTPDALNAAVLLLVGHWYKNREAVTLNTTNPAELPLAVEALCKDYRPVMV